MQSLAKLAFIIAFAYSTNISAQQITSRFYPEKQHYLVGEPIIVVLEIVNKSSKAIEFTEFNCPSLNPNQFEVDGASPKRTTELYGCGQKGIVGDCLGSSRKVRGGRKYRERFLLEGDFELDSPGRYHIRAKRQFSADLNVASEFDVDLRAPNPGELEAAYKPLLRDLHSRDIMVRSFAASAVTQNPPSFAEAAILTLASDPVVSTESIEGLRRLATPATRAKLREMASMTSPEYDRQPAIQALGEIGNPEDCQAMLAIANENKNYTQAEAYIVAGHICKERALPTLNGLVGVSDSQLLMGVTGGFANTSSRGAVPPLISLLQSPDHNARQAAKDGLATLTHRTSEHGIEDEDSAKQSHAEWLNWWAASGNAAPMYDGDQCMAPQPLP